MFQPSDNPKAQANPFDRARSRRVRRVLVNWNHAGPKPAPIWVRVLYRPVDYPCIQHAVYKRGTYLGPQTSPTADTDILNNLHDLYRLVLSVAAQYRYRHDNRMVRKGMRWIDVANECIAHYIENPPPKSRILMRNGKPTRPARRLEFPIRTDEARGIVDRDIVDILNRKTGLNRNPDALSYPGIEHQVPLSEGRCGLAYDIEGLITRCFQYEIPKEPEELPSQYERHEPEMANTSKTDVAVPYTPPLAGDICLLHADQGSIALSPKQATKLLSNRAGAQDILQAAKFFTCAHNVMLNWPDVREQLVAKAEFDDKRFDCALRHEPIHSARGTSYVQPEYIGADSEARCKHGLTKESCKFCIKQSRPRKRPAAKPLAIVRRCSDVTVLDAALVTKYGKPSIDRYTIQVDGTEPRVITYQEFLDLSRFIPDGRIRSQWGNEWWRLSWPHEPTDENNIAAILELMQRNLAGVPTKTLLQGDARLIEHKGTPEPERPVRYYSHYYPQFTEAIGLFSMPHEVGDTDGIGVWGRRNNAGMYDVTRRFPGRTVGDQFAGAWVPDHRSVTGNVTDPVPVTVIEKSTRFAPYFIDCRIVQVNTKYVSTNGSPVQIAKEGKSFDSTKTISTDGDEWRGDMSEWTDDVHASDSE